MTYPSGLDTFDRKNPTDPLSDGHAELHNDISTAVEAIETELGTNPSGAEATVAARLTAGESATSGAQSTADAAIPKATLDAHSVLGAVTDDTPVAISVAEQTLVGRKTGGDVAALSASEAKTLLAIANTDVSGLGTASTKNVAVSGDAASGEVVKGSDSRLSDARTPTSTLAHASSHAAAGSDPVTLSASQITGTAVVTNDSRLSDARTPTAHAASHGTGQSDAITIAASQVTGTALVASTADAKGDLYVATAADTVTRLAVGSNGALLGASSGASTGLAWITNRMIPAAGETSTGWQPNGVSTISATASQGTLTVWPVYIPTAMTISDLSIYVNGAAAAGALWRLGFWTLNGTNSAPSTLIADLGTVDPTGTGQKTISSLSVALTQGVVGFGYALQGSGAGGGTAAGGINNIPLFGSTLNDPRIFAWNKGSETGAFGGTLGAVTAANSGLSMNFSYKRSA